jgi:hypothetical protein
VNKADLRGKAIRQSNVVCVSIDSDLVERFAQEELLRRNIYNTAFRGSAVLWTSRNKDSASLPFETDDGRYTNQPHHLTNLGRVGLSLWLKCLPILIRNSS